MDSTSRGVAWRGPGPQYLLLARWRVGGPPRDRSGGRRTCHAVSRSRLRRSAGSRPGDLRIPGGHPCRCADASGLRMAVRGHGARARAAACRGKGRPPRESYRADACRLAVEVPGTLLTAPHPCVNVCKEFPVSSSGDVCCFVAPADSPASRPIGPICRDACEQGATMPSRRENARASRPAAAGLVGCPTPFAGISQAPAADHSPGFAARERDQWSARPPRSASAHRAPGDGTSHLSHSPFGPSRLPFMGMTLRWCVTLHSSACARAPRSPNVRGCANPCSPGADGESPPSSLIQPCERRRPSPSMHECLRYARWLDRS